MQLVVAKQEKCDLTAVSIRDKGLAKLRSCSLDITSYTDSSDQI